MKILNVIQIIAFLSMLVAFGMTYYTNDMLLKHNAKLFEELQICRGK